MISAAGCRSTRSSILLLQSRYGIRHSPFGSMMRTMNPNTNTTTTLPTSVVQVAWDPTWRRSFATSSSSSDPSNNNNKDNNTAQDKSQDTLRDAVNRLKNDSSTTTGSTTTSSHNDWWYQAAHYFDHFTAQVGATWQDLVKAGERKDINKKLPRPEATAEGDLEYTGPVSIMVIPESEHLTAWERMQRRLTEAPIIQDILTKTEQVYVKSGAQQVKQRIDHLAEDAREAWETSQNPWVYRASSVYDTLTAETAESMAVKELRVLDPTFTLDDWRQDVVEYTLPKIMEWLLQGKINQLKPWLGEAVFMRIASEIAARKQEGVLVDTHVLGIMNSEIIAVEVCFFQYYIFCCC